VPTTEETNKPVTEKKARARKEMPYKQAVIILVIGDLLCFLIFAALGRDTHGETSGFAAIPQIIKTALPFAAGWFLVSPFVGAFRHKILAQPRAMVIRTVLAWLLSWPIAMILRGIFVDHGIPPFSFAFVVLLFNTVLLLVWRWPFALNNRMRKGQY
jgi:cation transport ATPase